MLRVLVVALVLLVAIMTLLPRAARMQTPQVAQLIEPPQHLPTTDLVDQDGARVGLDALGGQFVLLAVGSTRCTEGCAKTLAAMAEARAKLAANAPGSTPEIVFVSVDAKRDTPAALRAYLRGFDPAFIGVTGEATKLAALLDALGVTAREAPLTTDVYFLGPDAQLLARSPGPQASRTLASDYLKIRGRYLATHRAPAQ